MMVVVKRIIMRDQDDRYDTTYQACSRVFIFYPILKPDNLS